MDGTVNDPEPQRPLPLAIQSRRRRPIEVWRSFWFPDDPGFVFFIRHEWPNFVTISILLLIPLLLSIFAHPFTPKYFALERGNQMFYPQYAYPKRSEYINTPVSAVISFAVPFAVMGLLSILLIGRFWDCSSALMGLGFSLCTADIFQLLLKLCIGGPRPHFYEVCQPGPPLDGAGYKDIYYTRALCTNSNRREVSEALMSFPSGHCTAAFAGFTYLALWLNAKFKVCADYKSRHWQQALLALPLLVAALLALSKLADYWHHWWDVLVGSLIGAAFALLSYRQMYAAVFDWRYNHIPLRNPWEVDPLANAVVARRDLTAINFAGWRNKYSETVPLGSEREKGSEAQMDGGVDGGVDERGKEMNGSEARRWDFMHFMA